MGLGIWLISSIAVLWLAGIIPLIPLSAEALTQKDVNNTQLQIDTIQEKISNIDDSIKAKDDLIKSLYEQRDQLRFQWELLESQKMSSWDALEQVGPVKAQLDGIIKTIESEARQLGTLYATKSSNVGKLDSLESLLVDQKYILSVTNRTISDYSTTKHIGVVLSQHCINMIKNDYPTTCPTYEELYSLDTSDQSISGSFGDNDGFYSRGEPSFKNSWRLYDTDDTPRIFVDPPKGMAERIKLITIESQLPEYFTISDLRVENGIRTWHESRYVENCRHATISGEQWKSLLPDTIFLFHNNCQSSDYNEIKYEKMPFTSLPLDETQYWKDKIWLEESKEKCRGLCFEY